MTDETFAEGPAVATRLVAGAQLGRFSLKHVLGEGGMGVVWAAHDPDLDRQIAIKVLRHHAAASPALRKRLLREARAMARLKHPNVITVYEVGSAGDTDFIAMELVDGVTMDKWLEADPPREDIMRALIAAGRGLAAAHAAGLVHRDFKPHNVLRSRDGRVLVTDFGLARGLGDDVAIEDSRAPELPKAVALEETLDARKSSSVTPHDSVLDSPLTQTGVMIGTPAYMAPEQFHGAPPDPRTDQFAYCVSAWQALTGARPFVGETLEELRDAASRGVEGVIANLEKPVRAALTRGLSPDPAKRWPSMEPLLDALEATRTPRVRAWPFVLAGAILIAAAIFVFARREDSQRRAAAGCAPAEQELAELESAGLDERANRALSQFRTKWTAKYQEACNAPPGKLVDARLACLRGVRDEASAVRQVLNVADVRVLGAVDLHGILPNVAMCDPPSPATPPIVPLDQPRRDKSLALIARGIMLRMVPRDQLPAAVEKLVADARAIGWKELPWIIEVTAGNIYLRDGDVARARALFRSTLKTAEVRFQALAHVGLLEASMHELEAPGYGDVRPKPGALHEELARLLTYARSAIRGAGDDPMLLGSVALLEAEARAAQGLWHPQSRKTALALAAEARNEFERAGDVRRAAIAAAAEARIYLARANPRALDDALFTVRSAEESVQKAGLEPVRALDELRAKIAFAKSDYREAHDRYERISKAPAAVSGVAKKGRIVDKAGKPVRGVVVAWHGELHGDSMRVFTRPQFDGEVIETDEDGTFTFHTGDAIIAETTTGRSMPRAAVDGVQLVIEPAITLESHTEGVRSPLVTAFVRYRIGSATWFVHAPVGRDGTYTIEALPSVATDVGLAGAVADGLRRTTEKRPRFVLPWPTGQAIEVILRVTERDDTATAWIFRGKVTAKTRADLESLARISIDVATASFDPIGAGATEPGREVYAPGDVHAIVTDNAIGELTVCVALVDLPTAKAYCQPMKVTAGQGVVPMLFETGAAAD